MPMPLWWGQVNKRTFNKLELERGVRPVLTHVGRSSGTTYRTPLDVIPVAGGYAFILVYGSRSDWVQNVCAAGTAGLRVEGQDVALANPRVLTDEEFRQIVPETTKLPPGFLNVTEFLRMDVVKAAA